MCVLPGHPKSDYRTPREIMDMKPPSPEQGGPFLPTEPLLEGQFWCLGCGTIQTKPYTVEKCANRRRQRRKNQPFNFMFADERTPPPFNVKDELLYPGEWPYDLVLSMPALITDSANYQFKIRTTALVIIKPLEVKEIENSSAVYSPQRQYSLEH